MSFSCADPQKISSCAHNSLRTRAKASEKVGRALSYQAAPRTIPSPLAMYRWARSATSENSSSNAGAVLWIARSDQCRWGLPDAHRPQARDSAPHAQGHPNPSIARQVSSSTKTVGNYVSNTFTKL